MRMRLAALPFARLYHADVVCSSRFMRRFRCTGVSLTARRELLYALKLATSRATTDID